ncbi:MAG: sensor histidine kinase [Deltaproteobacteria bacterium]|nr:sensor histidine kinase [Deltaproteobacteria bacterium]
MTPLYAYSLIPVLSVALLLFFSVLLYGRSMRGLTVYCAAIAVWSGSLLLFALPEVTGVAKHLAQVGAFVSASFIHAAYDFTKQRDYTLVWLAYAAAVVITGTGLVWPGLLYAPASLQAGPAFWPAMGLAIGATALPLWQIARVYPLSDSPTKRQLRTLAVSGVIGFVGAWLNAIALVHGIVVPYLMFTVLGSLLLLASLLQHVQQESGRRLLERSLLYAAMTALLSAGFLFGMMTLMSHGSEPLLGQYRLGALFLLFMAALAFEPLRLHIQQLMSRRLLTGHAGSRDLAVELARQEQRADHAERLAELGTFTSAVAHEIRNPLGVIAANVRLLESQGASAEVCAAIRQQVEGARMFVDDLLRYGRPRPLELRVIDVAATLNLARSTATNALPAEAAGVRWEGPHEGTAAMIEADQGQMLQVFVILFENSLQALSGRAQPMCRVHIEKDGDHVQIEVEDNGPGIPDALRDRIFEPFVTGRKREGSRSGTGLGLAIAKGIVERHQGTISVGTSPLGGACVEIRLPNVQKIVQG